MIHLDSVTKKFRNYKRGKGLTGSIKTLFSTEYDEITAIRDLSFDVKKGELLGVIGPNGAGKSTLVKMVTGILKPSSGSIEVLKRDPFRDRINNNFDIGVVFGQRTQLWWDIPVIESFNLLRDIYEVDEKIFSKNLNKFRDYLKLDKFINVPLRKLSLGQRMACDIVASLLHDPEIVYLDEPTIGLDISMKTLIRDFINEINRENKTTVILTSHDMSDIEKLASRLFIIDKGIIIFDGSIDEIKSRYGNIRKMDMEFSDIPHEEEIKKLEKLLSKKILSFNIDEYRGNIEFDRNIITSPEIFQLINEMMNIKDFSIEDMNIDSIIELIYKEGIN